MTVLAGFDSSKKDDPILDGDLTKSIAQSLVQCAVLSYKSRSEVEVALKPDKDNDRLLHFEWFEARGRSFDSQGFACIVPNHVILAFRGTKELRDFLTDALAVKKPLKDFKGNVTEGCAHLGFQRALNALWSDNRSARSQSLAKLGPPIDNFLVKVFEDHPASKLWLTGHSLGAALATITAARVQLTPDAPFKGKIGALVTVGSPRVLDRQGAERLMESLGRDRIFRIYRSIDPVPTVPPLYWGFRHVSGERRAFVSHEGKLVMGVRKSREWAESSAAFLRAVEDSVGSALPGQHRGYGAFVSDHDSEDYLTAVETYDEHNKLRLRDTLGPIAVPLLKLSGLGAGGWAVADTTGVTDLATQTVAATAQLLETGTQTMLAFLP